MRSRRAGRLARLVAIDALQAAETRYREFVEDANDMVYTHDLAGTFTALNRAAERLTGRLLGVTEEHLLRSAHLVLIDEVDALQAHAFDQAAKDVRLARYGAGANPVRDLDDQFRQHRSRLDRS